MKIFFKFLNLIFKFETIVISKFIAKKLFIKKYKILNPLIDLNYWKRKSIKISKINIPKITCVGNINKTKNYLNLLKYLNEIDIKFDLNIIEEVLKKEKKYFIKIKQIQNIINRNKFKKLNF